MRIFMANGKRKTGEILPRNYGIRLSMPRGVSDVFISPASYVLAQIMLETPTEIKARVREWARRKGHNAEEAINELGEAVRKREGSKNLLNLSRRTATRQLTDMAIEEMKHEGRIFRGDVRSKEKGSYMFCLQEPPRSRDVDIGWPGSRVENVEGIISEGKLKDATYVGVHMAIPEIALATDHGSGLAQSENMTGLFPAQRRMRNSKVPSLPFTFNFFKPIGQMNEGEIEQHRIVTDLLMEYYLDKATQYGISIRALENPKIFSQELVRAITGEDDRASFKVIRQKETGVSRDKITSEEDRRHASVRKMAENIRAYLEEVRSCYFAGYCREFVGTDWETVAMRFESRGRGPVYSVVTSEEHPPLVVGRRLGHKAEDWARSYDPVRKDHVAEKIGIKYSMIDDVTRRDSVVELILPDDALAKRGIHIPENLRREYSGLRRRIGEQD
jgi:hypothetical protein